MVPRVDVRAFYEMYFYIFLFWAVISTLLGKLVYVRYLTKFTWSRCAVADVTLNIVSAILNLVALPAAFLLWTLPRLALNRVIGVNDEDPVNWVALLLIVALITAVSDALVLRIVFKRPIGKRNFCLLYVINVLCVAVAACGAGFYSVAHPPTA